MKKPHLVLVMSILFLFCAGCTRPITGKIVDAETGQPIEGAILLVEWTKVHGFGNTYTTSEKVAEEFSDKEGKVKITGYNNPFVQSPDVTVYKPGYVAWNNHWIFPDRRNRTDFEWKGGYVFRLEKFKEGYSFDKHEGFISLCINKTLSHEKKKQFIDMYKEAESEKWKKELMHE